jgi:hypothetical protein
VSEHDVRVAFFQESVELQDQFRRFLQIRGDRGKILPSPVLKAGGDGRKGTEITAERDQLTSNRPRWESITQNLKRRVGASVHHKYNF